MDDLRPTTVTLQDEALVLFRAGWHGDIASLCAEIEARVLPDPGLRGAVVRESRRIRQRGMLHQEFPISRRIGLRLGRLSVLDQGAPVDPSAFVAACVVLLAKHPRP